VERVRERLRLARRALAALFAALKEPKSEISRDAAIQRFEYSFETVWKAAQAYLGTVENLPVASPGAAIRACFQTGLLSEDEARRLFEAARDRNLTVHTYNEELAEEVFSRLPAHAALLKEWLDRLEEQVSQEPGG